MATCEVIEKLVVQTPKQYVLTLTEQEAADLCDIFARVGGTRLDYDGGDGDPYEGTVRQTTDAVYYALGGRNTRAYDDSRFRGIKFNTPYRA